MSAQRTVTEVATAVALVVAVAAASVLLVSLALPALREPGLWLLFAVPVARNVVVVARGAGSERVLAVVGIVVVVSVIFFALGR